MPQARLAALADELGLPEGGVYLKLDVQGSEAKALECARPTLARVVAIETELTLVPLYRDQLLSREMLDLLDEAGYDPASLSRRTPTRGHVLQVDGIFLRRAHAE